MDNTLHTKILLVGKNRMGNIDACFVSYSKYGVYNWLEDALTIQLQSESQKNNGFKRKIL